MQDSETRHMVVRDTQTKQTWDLNPDLCHSGTGTINNRGVTIKSMRILQYYLKQQGAQELYCFLNKQHESSISGIVSYKEWLFIG